MKKHKSISNWMTSALGKPPLTTHCTTDPSSQHHTLTSTSRKMRNNQTSKQPLLPSKTRTTGRRVKPNTATSLVPAPLADSDIPWSQKHSPISVGDLAVHKKKITEVQQWLDFALSPAARHPMLLLTGPPGCGKTATVCTLARDMGCTILEWVNPVTDVGGSEAEPQPGDLVVYAESQTNQFRSFLVRANRYPSLQLGGANGCGLQLKKIVIVEDFPNAFLRDPNKFHELIKSVAPSLHYPLVFIVSESHRKSFCAHNLFSKSALTTQDIHTISFNPVAHTTLVKTLLRIASSECGTCSSGGANAGKATAKGLRDGVRYHLPPREIIEQLADSSVGDIRSAVNALQFTCLADSRAGGDAVGVKGQRSTRLKRTRSGSTKMKRHSSSDGGARAAIGGRDNSLFLFRALGKILYCKRESVEREEEEGEGESEGWGEKTSRDTLPHLPSHLKEHERSRLLVDPESVLEHSHLSSDMFTLYLHQNYLLMHSDIDDVVRASEYLSASDLISRPWIDSQTTVLSLQRASSSVATRGLMHSHRPATTVRGGNKWRPLHKPQWISTNCKYHENCQTARRLFLHLGQSPHAHLWTPVELQTEILPHLALTNMTVRNPDQAALLQSVTHFSHGYSRIRAESLGERDVDGMLTQEAATCSVDTLTNADNGTSDNTAGKCVGSVPSQESGGSVFHTVSQDVGMGPVDSPDEIEDFEDDMIW